MIAQVGLLEAIRGLRINPRFLAVGSDEEYKMVCEDELPIREGNPLRPLSPYAVSEVAQDLMEYQYFRSYDLSIVRSRAFNHTGARRGDVFVESNVAKQVTEIEAGLCEPVVSVGTSLLAATSLTCVTSCAGTGSSSSAVSRARCTTSARGVPGPSRRSWNSCWRGAR
jgi:hypothetical protein